MRSDLEIVPHYYLEGDEECLCCSGALLTDFIAREQSQLFCSMECLAEWEQEWHDYQNAR